MAAPQDGETPPPPVPAPAEEAPEKPAPQPETKPEEKPPSSDAEAVALLKKAAERQGGKSLEGGITAFRAVFGTATFYKDSFDDRIEGAFSVDKNGLVMEWMSPSSLRTSVTHNGKTKIRGRGAHKFGGNLDWLDDGGNTTTLTGERHAKDIERLDGQLDLVQALLDVVLLRKMLTDGSVWKLGKAPDAEHVSLVRMPPEPAGDGRLELALALIIDAETCDVAKVLVLPRKDGDVLVEYDLGYHADFPKTKGADGVRFPFRIAVTERTDPSDVGSKVIELAAVEVAFNGAAGLTPDRFLPPKANK